VPVVHFAADGGVPRPILVCVYLDVGGEELRENLAACGTPPPIEGRDYGFYV
jgi:hypothetical protein